ncbi:oxidoreductase, short chain dehydrogenase/reductase family protein (macronuclear) [Tetrahymena thermophila SB210]|uniref:Oxidoreductase, short chain dehydrogenase/reductase family protein n=1 Tax=Tetrahymena thermophila (strain SB210) TaxID=312017 RepID=I7M455_TETTS|nr:oxidoreductase, short chain dehydrogenase/reductase family protein [Tetrahymena thermophila SB210]EAS04939.1 oxidoreductase, short chain dehydrogenase/reductase family protein [Tetrahymena thermophila SB210]|eukprot:XP_001025184.1 oxidoreductase, short chain dehydrogenase/reductase family protein [Tetrahymena thermophila SB210]
MNQETDTHSIESSHSCCCSMYYYGAAVVFILLITVKNWVNGGKVSKRRDLSNEVIIVTGGNSGIGFETCKDLVRNGAKVILATRNEQRGQNAIKELNKIRPNSSEFMKLDLSDLTSIRLFANEFKSKYNKLNCLINNAGIMAISTRVLTKDGFESQIGTNHFGHFLLTNLLFDVLKQTPQFRIINVSSRAHIRNTINLDDINFSNTPYQKFYAYSASKIANILFTQELQKKFDAKKINGKAMCLHPGVVRTELASHFPYYNIVYPILYPIALLLLKSPEAGAQTTLQCVHEDFSKLESGKYYVDCKVHPTGNKTALTTQNAERLWDMSVKLVKLDQSI